MGGATKGATTRKSARKGGKGVRTKVKKSDYYNEYHGHTTRDLEVVADALPEVGKTEADYVQRVEPSAQGGRKMARAILDAVEAH